MLRRLADRGVLKNENATVTSLVTKQDVQRSRLTEMVDETFEGSMPAFIAAFSHSKRLSKSEVDQLREMIDNYKEE